MKFTLVSFHNLNSGHHNAIVRILTLPEVGGYDMPRNPEKSVSAFEKLKRLLYPGGQLVLVVGPGLDTQFEMSKNQNYRI